MHPVLPPESMRLSGLRRGFPTLSAIRAANPITSASWVGNLRDRSGFNAAIQVLRADADYGPPARLCRLSYPHGFRDAAS